MSQAYDLFVPGEFVPLGGTMTSSDATISGGHVWLAEGTGNVVPPRQHQANWLNSAADDVLEWLAAGEGWDSYGAAQISSLVVATTYRLLSVLSKYGMPRPFIAGTSEGGLEVSWDSDRYSVHIHVGLSGLEAFVWDKAANAQWEGIVSGDASELGEALLYLSTQPW
jgi:hypothetical protein